MPASTALAFSWNSELPSGHNPFWIRDDGLAGLDLHPGDAVSVDTRIEPSNGDLVVAEAEVDGDSQRLARRYSATEDEVELATVPGSDAGTLRLPSESVIVMGVIVGRIHFTTDAAPREEPLAEP